MAVKNEVVPDGSFYVFTQGYKVYFTTNPNLPLEVWNDQMVNSNHLTTVSDLTPYTVYTIRVTAYTIRGAGPPSSPVQVKTQQGGNFDSFVPELHCLVQFSYSRHVTFQRFI